ncbi:putative 6-phospho-beta-glucosidase (plasmid) [Asticcacaulis sp. MM231]|uniref:family 4 glycosyl hydrolase n=1 Tax=Asticcacaulis sp. MM231 TaxID=3157666 RepID=UPI0032D596AB
MTKPTNGLNGKVSLIGGGGIRTPLVIFGINDIAQNLGIREMALYDPDENRVQLMAALGRAIVAREGGTLKITVADKIEAAVEGCDYIMNSIRVGGITSRAADELAAIKNNYPGQETTGPAGAAMALRTVPVVLEQARIVEKYAPEGWIVSFTNPAGLITQALSTHTNAKVVGICDTPTELMHHIARALGARHDEVHCEYIGLNHLGWIRKIRLRGEDITAQVLADDALLASFYHVPLFDGDMIRQLGLIPTEYLYFYYNRRKALDKQKMHGGSRGAEVEKLNESLLKALDAELRAGSNQDAIATYAAYLNRRSGSYMRLEAKGGSAFDAEATFDEDPFRVASGYHKIAMDVITALSSEAPSRIIVNTRNNGTLSDLAAADIIETPCQVSRNSIIPEPLGRLPDEVKGLVHAVKAYERAAIKSAMTAADHQDNALSHPLARLIARKAFLLHPAIGDWEASDPLLHDLLDPTCIHC